MVAPAMREGGSLCSIVGSVVKKLGGCHFTGLHLAAKSRRQQILIAWQSGARLIEGVARRISLVLALLPSFQFGLAMPAMLHAPRRFLR